MKSNENQKIKKYLDNTTKKIGIVFIGRILGYILGYFITFILARLYGSEVVGHYNLVNTIIFFVSIFTVFGLDNGLLKFVSKYKSLKNKSKLKDVVKICFYHSMILSILGFFLLYFLRDFISNKIFNDNELSNIIFYGAFIIFPLSGNKLFNGLYRGFKKFKYYILGNNIIRRLLFITILLFFYFFNLKNILFVIIGLLFSHLVTFIYLFYNTKWLDINLKNIFLSNSSDKKIKKEILKFSSSLILISFMGVILSRIDKIMLGIFMDSKYVGIYSVGSKVTTLVNFLFVSTNVVFSSIISELYSLNEMKLLENLYSIITKWIIIITLPIVTSIIIFPKNIMGFFGDEFIIGSTVLIILSIGQMINSFVGSNAYILKMTENQNKVLINNFITAGINIILNIILIPKYGINGAAIATSTSIVVVNILQVIEVKYILNIFPYNKNYIHIILNIILISLSVFLTKIYLNNLIGVILVTLFNIMLSIFISFIFSNNYEKNIILTLVKKFFK